MIRNSKFIRSLNVFYSQSRSFRSLLIGEHGKPFHLAQRAMSSESSRKNNNFRKNNPRLKANTTARGDTNTNNRRGADVTKSNSLRSSCSPLESPLVHRSSSTLHDLPIRCPPVQPKSTRYNQTNSSSGENRPPTSSPVSNQESSNIKPSDEAPSGGHESGGNNTKLLLGILALVLGGAGTYYYAFSDDEEDTKNSGKKQASRPRVKAVPVKSPATGEELPKHVQYLLIGGGAACFSAFRSIKSLDPKAEVLLIGQESEFPYMRPPLSKEMWLSDAEMRETMMFRQWNGSVRSVYFEPDSFYMEPKALAGSNKGGVVVAKGWRVERVDPENKQAILDDGTAISYDKCLLAPGSSPKALPLLKTSEKAVKDRVFYFRDISDFKNLSKATEKSKEVVIIGGGFLGSELACSLTHNGRKVTQLFREEGLLAKLLPRYLSKWLTEQVRGEGVQVVPNSEVTSIDLKDNRLVFTLSNGKKVDGDLCVVATGAVPNTELAKPSRLETHPQLGGYLVNSEMMSRSSLYIAGDAACFYDERWGRRRVEHHDHAVVSGRLAGENMVGAGKSYSHISMLWSDLSPDIGWEGVGILDPTLPTTGVFALSPEPAQDEKETAEKFVVKDDTQTSTDVKPQEKFNKGLIFYHKDGVIVGVLLWNIFNRMALARQILKGEYKSEDVNEIAKLFRIHED